MKTIRKWSVVLACAAFAGCAGLGAQRREAKAASQKTAGADLAVSEARQAGAKACALKELKLAETDLQMARSNLEKKDYSLSIRFAESANANAAAAVAKCKEAGKRAKKK